MGRPSRLLAEMRQWSPARGRRRGQGHRRRSLPVNARRSLLRPRPHADGGLERVPLRPRDVQGRAADAAARSRATRSTRSGSGCKGATDAAVNVLLDRVMEGIKGHRVVDLARLTPDVLAGILPRVYPQMLAVVREHQDAGRPCYIATAASQPAAEILAEALVMDGAIGTRWEIEDGVYTGRLDGPVRIRRGQGRARCASSPRERGHRPRAVVGLHRRGLRSADAGGGRPSGGRQSRRRARGDRAGARAGRCCASRSSASACGWRGGRGRGRGRRKRHLARARAAARPAAGRCRAQPPPRADLEWAPWP